MSIGIPVYNGERYLADALESALSQDYEPIEVIISNNASTDGTAAIAQRFVELDRRVRYVCSPRNLGFVQNFLRVLAEARGTYFSWLAHDDQLSDRQCLTRIVDYLERHRDAAVCACDYVLLDFEGQGSRLTKAQTEIYPDRPWRTARLEFFRWPERPAYQAIFGVFRREPLARIRVPRPIRNSARGSAFFQFIILTLMCGSGRIVALPQALRAFRDSYPSETDRLLESFSPFDLFTWGLGVKLIMLQSALRIRLPLSERAELLRVALGNLWKANLERPTDYPWLIAERQKELGLLGQVAQERLELIHTLNAEIEKRRRIVRELGLAG